MAAAKTSQKAMREQSIAAYRALTLLPLTPDNGNYLPITMKTNSIQLRVPLRALQSVARPENLAKACGLSRPSHRDHP